MGGCLLDHCPLRFRHPEAASTVEGWREKNPRPEVMLLGSSRLGSFTETSLLREETRRITGDDALQIYNASVTHGDPIAIEFIARRLLAEGGAPRLAIIEISPDLVSRCNPFFEMVITRQLLANELPSCLYDIFHSSTKSISRLASSRLTPFFRHRTTFLDWLCSNFVLPSPVRDEAAAPMDGIAWEPIRKRGEDDPRPRTEHIAESAQRFARYLRHFELAGRTPEALEHTLKILHERGCATVLVQVPLSEPHRRLFTPAIQTQFVEFVQRLQKEYGCAFADFSDRIPDALFTDTHHSGDEGAKVFSALLAKEVVAPCWIRVAKNEAVKN